MSKDTELANYFAEAVSWDADREAQRRRTTRVAWSVAGAGWSCAVIVAAALMLLMPLKRVEPFVIRVDNTTGVVDVVPVYAGKAQVSEAVTRYFLEHYVTVCERFNFSTAESDYEECGSFHTPARNQAWYALWNRTNPASPLNVYKEGSTLRAQVSSVSFFAHANDVADLAQVRYIKLKRQAGGPNEQVTHWIATMAATMSRRDRLMGLSHEMSIPLPEEILNDFAASEWLKKALRSTLVRDPVGAANDAYVLAAVLQRCVQRLL